MKLKIKAGTTSRILRVFVQDTSSTTGAGLTGLAYNTSGLKCYYARVGASSGTVVSLVTATAGTWTSAGFVALDGTNMPGVYELHIPNAAIAASATAVHVMLYGAANMAPVLIEIELDAVDYQSAANFGLTSLPDVAHSNSGGLITFGTSTGQFDPSLGQVKVLGSQQISIAGKVWDEARSSHTTSGTFGAYVLAKTDGDAAIAPASTALSTATWTGTRAGYLDNISSAPPAASAIADAVWDEARSGHTTTGTYGAYVLARTDSDATIAPSSTALSTAQWTNTRAGYLDNLSAGAVATASALTTVGGNVTTILGQTGTTGVVIASGAITASTIASDAITAAKIAAGAIDADALATDAVTEIWSVAVPGSFASGTAAYVLGNIATGTPPTAAAIADAVWDEARTGHTTSGTFGFYLDSAISGVSGGGGATAADIADAVWDEARSGHTTAGTFGAYVLAKTDGDAAIAPASTALSTATWTGTRAGYLDNLSAGAVATASALSTAAGNITTILGQTGTTGVVVASGSKTGYSLSSSQTFNLTGNITGNLSGSVGSVGTGGITSSSFAAGAIDAAAIAADAIGSSELAASAATEIANAVLTTQMTESYAADGTAPTLAQAVFLVQQRATEFAISGSTITVKKLDGSTTAATLTMDSSSSPTSSTRTG